MLSKKYYKAIAKIISDTKTEHENNPKIAMQHLEYRLREYFAEDNPKFNRVKFAEACRIVE